MTDIRDKFYEKLKERNAQQRKAVEAITGPVMVVAGPGTGKTDVLGLRIGNILEKTDTNIHNILCLTYTESGAVEMRKRLLDYVGPVAYNAQMYTFHGFCNLVIHENIELFGLYRDFQPVSALEQFQILKEVIDLQPMDHPLKRYSGQIYFETRRLKSLFDTMKLEQWSVDHMHQAIDRWEEEMKESEEFIYKRKTTAKGKTYQKGDLKESTFRKKVVAPMLLLHAAVDTFETYNKLLRDRGRYDYHDMLTWVHDQFRDNDFLLGQYQERFQYFLVDEFQDSNGIQMSILNLLVSQWGPDSDIFIVGDDDQSIFRFQGAMMKNILEFKELYNPEVIVLTENYRSTQHILDAASSVIKWNKERLVAQYPEYTKNLVARAEHAASDSMPEVHVYPNWTQEVASLLKELTELHNSGGLKTESVAVIYRKHRQVEEIVHALEVRQIPINVKRPVNILERPVIRNIMTILRYIKHELAEAGSGEPLLYELMHYRYFNISVRDAGVLAVECRRMSRDKKTYWRDVMADEELQRNIGIHDPAPIVALDTLLNTWVQEFEHLTLQVLVEQVFTKGGVLNWIFNSANRSWHLQLIKTFFDYVKNESQRNPNIGLYKFLEDIDLMQEHGIELPVNKILTNKDGIYFVTAHSAKGMEFDRVYMLGCTKRVWDTGRGGPGSFKLPETLSPVTASGSDEDERRLFYVAMTRARTQLIMSYSLLDENEREQESSRFVQEVLDGGVVTALNKELNEEDFALYCMDLMTPLEVRVPLVDYNLIDRVLENFVLSVSALNLYLECPRKFYFDYILRIPSARKAFFGFGKAIHSALEQFFTWNVENQEVTGTAEDLIDYYHKYLRLNQSHFTQREYELNKHNGDNILKTYFEQRAESWKLPIRSEVEYRINDAHHKGVPIKGVLDRLDVYKDMVVVTDYKTGKASNAGPKLRGPKKEGEIGGNYWRQIVFYKLLIDADIKTTKIMIHGNMDFVQSDADGHHKLAKIIVSPEDEKLVSDQIVDTYERITNHEFHSGCDDKDCYWCNLVKNEMKVDVRVQLPEEREVIIDN